MLCQILVLLFGLSLNFAAEIPMMIQYQGRLVDAASDRPVPGTVSRQMVFSVRQPGQTTQVFSHTASNVTVKDGVFSVDIPVPSTILFDRPYTIDVLIQGGGGGIVGAQALKTVPYVLTSKNALQLQGVSAREYSARDHIHTTSGNKVFTVDGSSSNLLAGDPQFTVLDQAGRIVFRINASGDIERVNQVEAGDILETFGGVKVENNGVETFKLDASGNLVIKGDLLLSSNLDTGSMRVTNNSSFNNLSIDSRLEFLSGSTLTPTVVNPGGISVNLVGFSHRMDEHRTSAMLTKLLQLTGLSGGGVQIVTSGLHTHSINASEVPSTALADNSIQARHFASGSLFSLDFSTAAQIADSKLATISSTGKITTAALPSEVVLQRVNNIFGAGVTNTSVFDTVQTTNEFDALRAKIFFVLSPIIGDGTYEFLSFTNLSKDFKWALNREGTLSLTKIQGLAEEKRLEIKTESGKTLFKMQNVEITADNDLINGSVVKDGSIKGENIQAAAVQGTHILDGSLTSSHIATDLIGRLAQDKLVAGSITAEKIKDDAVGAEKILDGAVEAAKIQDASISDTVIAAGSLTSTRIAAGNITNVKLKTRTLTSQEVQDGSLTQDLIVDASLTSAKFADQSIPEDRLSSDVIRYRTRPFSISFSTVTTPNMILASTLNDSILLRLRSGSTAESSLATPAIFVSAPEQVNDNTKQAVSLNIDGSIGMLGTNMGTTAVVSPQVMGVVFGASRSDGKCPSASNYEHVKDSNSLDRGTGFCIRYINTVTLTNGYLEAVARCQAEGSSSVSANLCSVEEMRRACNAGKLSGSENNDIMTGDTGVQGGAIHFHTFNPAASSTTHRCANSSDFSLTSFPFGTNKAFACCLNPF